jgi:hypothetical protein
LLYNTNDLLYNTNDLLYNTNDVCEVLLKDSLNLFLMKIMAVMCNARLRNCKVA